MLLIRSEHRRASHVNSYSTPIFQGKPNLNMSTIAGLDPLSNIFRDSEMSAQLAGDPVAMSTPPLRLIGKQSVTDHSGLTPLVASFSYLGQMRSTDVRNRAYNFLTVGTPGQGHAQRLPALSISAPTSPRTSFAAENTTGLASVGSQESTTGKSESNRRRCVIFCIQSGWCSNV